MTLDRSCPLYLKEKKIRDLMAQFNCTYKKALMIYVPPVSPTPVQEPLTFTQDVIEPVSYDCAIEDAGGCSQEKQTYAAVVKPKARTKKPPVKKNAPRCPTPFVPEVDFYSSSPEQEKFHSSPRKQEKSENEVKFEELLSKLANAIFFKSGTFFEKLKCIIRHCLEWLILVAVENISDWPALKMILEYLNG